MIAFLVFQALSVYTTGVRGIAEEAGFWSAYAQFVALSLLLITDERALVRYVWGMIFGSIFVVGYGIYAVLAELPSAVGGRAGAYGMYENHNDFSFLIIQVLPFIYMYVRRATGFAERWFLLLALVACVAGIFMSLSRGGMLALVLELALITWLTVQKRRRLLLMPVIFVIGVLAINYQWAERAENQGDSYTAADAQDSRMELWRAARSMVLDRPLLGVGSRTFGEHSREYGEISRDNRGKNSHNTYLEVVATSGLLGFLAFVMMLRSMTRDLGRRTDSPPDWLQATRTAATISFYAIAFRAVFDAKAHDWSFYFLLVVAIASTLLVKRRESGETDPHGLVPWGTRYGASSKLVAAPGRQ
jgi:O-antigen ligase